MAATRWPLIPASTIARRCACPRCGEGPLFDGFLRIAETCSHCGLALARNDSGDGPAVFLIFILGTIAVPLAFLLDHLLALPLWAPAAITGVVVLALALVMLRPAKAYVIALQFRHRREDFEV